MVRRRSGIRPAKGETLNVSGLAIEGLEDVVQIGTGGSSRVYRARQTALDRVVAVKVINASQDPSVARRFDRERKAMGRLSSHEGIVPVYSTGVTGLGEPYLVMPYYPDGSLQDQIDAGPVPWQIAVRYVDVAAETISVAHGAGIVHLDIKPANILLTPSGAPRIADFGIAKLTSSAHTARTTGTAFTPAYSAPETFLDGKATPAADVYGLGATLWALLVGHPPFLAPGDDANLMAVIGRVVNNPTGQINHLAPREICDVVYRAMEKRPEDRFASASDFSAALKQALNAESQGAQLAGQATAVAAAPAPLQHAGDSTQIFASSGPVVASARTMSPGPATVQPYDDPGPPPAFEPEMRPGRSLLQSEAEAAPHVVAYREPVQRSPILDFDRFRLGPLLVGLIALLGVGMLAAWALNRPGSNDTATNEAAVPAAPEASSTTESTSSSTSVLDTVVDSGFGDETGTADQTSSTTTTQPTSTVETTATTAETTTSTETTETTVEETTTSTEEETTSTSEETTTSSTTEPDGDLQAPSSFAAELDGTSVRLTWSAPAAGPAPASYVVYRDGDPLANVDEPPYVDESPSVGEHSYRVGSVSNGVTVLSNAVRIVVPEPPVEDFAATAAVRNVTDDSITLEITSNQCISRYRIGYMVTPDPGQPGVPLGPIAERGLTCSGPPVPITVRMTGLNPNTSYDISVTAFNEDDEGSTYDFPGPVVTQS